MNNLDKIFNNSKRVKIDDTSKIVIMSDCHRGAGNNHDNFITNQNIFEYALKYYYKNDFLYLELGDGDEMWEVKNYNDIINEHLTTFKLLKKFNDTNRLIMIYGNHDICKKSKNILKEYFYKYYNKITKTEEELLNDIDVYESLILEYKDHEIFLVHGHQVDFLNYNLWKLSRFLVRHVWRHFENIGMKNPTSSAKNHKEVKKIEKKLIKWSNENNKIIITGHTHRPMYPVIGKSLYFNDGSCIHPNGITCLEIESGRITLVKWVYELNDAEVVSVGRRVLEGNESLNKFFEN